MLRNILRTSRWVVRQQINSLATTLRPNLLVVNCKCSSPLVRQFSAPSDSLSNLSSEHIESAVFEEICSETLESLCDYFEELAEQAPELKGADVTYSDGVLTVALGPAYGTYVINRQTPNKQIWLSSPVSGPKRYDLVLKDGGHWVYKHDSVALHKLLQTELSQLLKCRVDFSKCSHSLV